MIDSFNFSFTDWAHSLLRTGSWSCFIFRCYILWLYVFDLCVTHHYCMYFNLVLSPSLSSFCTQYWSMEFLILALPTILVKLLTLSHVSSIQCMSSYNISVLSALPSLMKLLHLRPVKLNPCPRSRFKEDALSSHASLPTSRLWSSFSLKLKPPDFYNQIEYFKSLAVFFNSIRCTIPPHHPLCRCWYLQWFFQYFIPNQNLTCQSVIDYNNYRPYSKLPFQPKADIVTAAHHRKVPATLKVMNDLLLSADIRCPSFFFFLALFDLSAPLDTVDHTPSSCSSGWCASVAGPLFWFCSSFFMVPPGHVKRSVFITSWNLCTKCLEDTDEWMAQISFSVIQKSKAELNPFCRPCFF